jgi:hypothetical protein
MGREGTLTRAAIGLGGLVLGFYLLRSGCHEILESAEYMRKAQGDRVPPAGYVVEDGTRVYASKSWQEDDNISALLPNGDLVHYINEKGDDARLESVIVVSGDESTTFSEGDPEFAKHQADYGKHIEKIRTEFELYRAIEEGRRMRDMHRY